MTQTVLLGDVGRVVTGKTPPKAHPEYWGDDLDFITPTDFKDSKYISPVRKLSESGGTAMKRIICPAKSVIVTCIGSDMGKVALAQNDFVSNQQINTLIVDPEKASPEFIYYLLKFNRPLLRKYAESGGSTMPIINKSTFERLSFTIPDLETQKKIADILGTIDEKIELNRKMNETLEQMGQALFRHYFIDNPESEKWQEQVLGDYLKVERGLSYKGAYLSDDSADTPMINLGSFALDGAYNGNNIKYYNGEFKERTIVHPGDLVLANTDMTQDRVVLGAILRAPGLADKMLFTHHVYSLRSLKLPREFIYYLLKRPSFRERAQGFATGTTVLFMPAEAITKLHFKVPSEDLLDRFSNEARAIFERKEIARVETQTLTEIRDALLPRLINGKINV